VATPVTTPFDTVAIDTSSDDHGVDVLAVPEPTNVTSEPIHTDTAADGLIVGGANTVTLTSAATPPAVYVTVYVVPPLDEVKAAVDVVVVDDVEAILLPELELQAPPAGVAVNVKLPSSHTSVTVEVIDGAALTVKVAVA